MSLESRTLNTLLAKGICEYSPDLDMESSNRLLRPLSYEIVLWPGKTHFVLRDLSGPGPVLLPWKESTVDEAKIIFGKLAMKERVGQSPVQEMLEERGWLERDSQGALALTKRALVQFDEYLISLEGRYRRCGLCRFLVDSGSYHSYCESILSRKSNNIH